MILLDYIFKFKQLIFNEINKYLQSAKSQLY